MGLRALTDSGRLVDVVPLERERFETGTDLVPLDTERCPRCGVNLDRTSVWQDSIVRHGGYGGTQRVDIDWCPCGFERIVAVATERPPR